MAGRAWLAAGFDERASHALGLRSRLPDLLLYGALALVSVAALAAVGALLTTALLLVPAATTRLVVRRLPAWQLATMGLAAAEGVAGLWLAVRLDVPPGAAIAVLAGAVFALVAAAGARVAARRCRGRAGRRGGGRLRRSGHDRGARRRGDDDRDRGLGARRRR